MQWVCVCMCGGMLRRYAALNKVLPIKVSVSLRNNNKSAAQTFLLHMNADA